MKERGYPKINIWMFIHDWNANLPSERLKKIYGFKTVIRVNNYVQKLRKEGHNLRRRSHKGEDDE